MVKTISQCVLERDRMAAKKRMAITYLGGGCAKCGFTSEYHEAFDFHHKNPKEDDVRVSNLWDKPWQRIKKELDKCELLCVLCHRINHAKVRRELKKPIERMYEEVRKTLYSTPEIRKKLLDDFILGIVDCKHCGKTLKKKYPAQKYHKACKKPFYKKKFKSYNQTTRVTQIEIELPISIEVG